MATINVGIIGVGNCAASLVQGLAYYRDPAAGRAGLAHPICAGYAVADIRITAAFDVQRAKIGRDLAEAIWVAPNNALSFAPVEPLGVSVQPGILADGIAPIAAGAIDAQADATLASIVGQLRQTDTRVLVNFLPTGSQQAAEIYASAALQAGCALLNAMPAVIARSPAWERQFVAAGLPLLGDDLKSQFGATLIHHALIEALGRNGVALRSTSQHVSGGNMDFLTLQDPSRVASKRATKVQGLGGAGLPPEAVRFSAEYAPGLKDRKIAELRLTGEAFGGTALEIALTMEVEDSPSAAGAVLDGVRYLGAALDRRLAGVIDPMAALLMKAPPRPLDEAEALAQLARLLG